MNYAKLPFLLLAFPLLALVIFRHALTTFFAVDDFVYLQPATLQWPTWTQV